MILNKQEAALVLAGLRLLQFDLEYKREKWPKLFFHILAEVEDTEGMIDNIDRLCEDKINVVAEPADLETKDGRIVRHILITGNPVDGLQFTGPFNSQAEADDQAEGYSDTDYWIADLLGPM